MELVFIHDGGPVEGKSIEAGDSYAITPYPGECCPRSRPNIGLHVSRFPPVAEIPVMNQNLIR